jgi:glycosyltransferase involved in cell wall biosynthesis
MGVHLFVPMLHRRDAVGEHTLALRDRLRARGLASKIFTELPDPATATETSHYLDYASEAEPGDVLVYQFATESSMAGWLAARPEPTVINFHSITPPQYFAPWNNAIARLQVEAGQQLDALAPRAALGIATSAFTAHELRQAGCTNTVVVPVAGLSLPTQKSEVGTAGPHASRESGRHWLSVGRWAPNKAHHETIAALFVTRMTKDSEARLTLIGSPTEPAYAAALRRYAAALGLAGAVEFLSGVSDEQLAAHYREADVLVMLSDHEGFGVPLVEAMSQRLPIVAFDAGAVAEVLGGCGVLLQSKHPRSVAAAVDAVLKDPAERSRLIEQGQRRFEALGAEDVENLLVEAILTVSAP